MAVEVQAELPLVSAVIPTRNRPEIVCRAVRSALNQTYQNLEVVVVIDGPDPDTVSALEALNEPRVRIVALSENVGGSEARNVGVREARGEWIALLDDDDEWLPEKIEYQRCFTVSSEDNVKIVATQYVDRSSKGDVVQPQVFQRKDQPISEYLFCEIPVLRPRQGFLQTSTLLVARELLITVPFTCGLKRNQDSDWLLRAVPRTGLEVRIVPTILAIFHNEQSEGRISQRADWRDSYEWCRANKHLFTNRAFSFYLAAFCLPSATRAKEGMQVYLMLFKDCFKEGKASPKIYWFFIRHTLLVPSLNYLMPRSLTARFQKLIHH